MRHGRPRRDGLGAYWLVLLTVVGTAAIATFAFGPSRRTVHSTAEHFHRHLVASSYDPISAALHGYGPHATHARPGKPVTGARAVVLHPDRIELLAGGRIVRTIPIARGQATLADVVRAVHDPRWLAQRTGVVTARAAVIAGTGSSLVVAAPVTKTLLLERRAGVFLGARGATLELRGVTVRPTSPADTTRQAVDGTRPFVLAQRSSQMVIRNSIFRGLGRDWNTSYGVSWASGSSGAITGSEVVGCFIGVYSERAHDLVIRGNRLLGNTLYGIDPHSGSRHVLVERNVSEGNGRHGIIFSQDVTGSVVRGNVASGNRLNGIMMDAGSTGNLISANVSEHNRGDGIVLANSPGNAVIDNRIADNRIGIYVRGGDEQTFSRNEITENARASLGTRLDGTNVERRNGGQWLPRRVAAIWIGVVPLVLVLWLLTWWSRSARDRRLRQRVGRMAR